MRPDLGGREYEEEQGPFQDLVSAARGMLASDWGTGPSVTGADLGSIGIRIRLTRASEPA